MSDECDGETGILHEPPEAIVALIADVFAAAADVKLGVNPGIIFTIEFPSPRDIPLLCPNDKQARKTRTKDVNSFFICSRPQPMLGP